MSTVLKLLAVGMLVLSAAAWAAEAPAPAPPAPPAPMLPAAPVTPAAEAPAAGPRSPVLDHVPDDADFAVLVRLAQLVQTPLWKRLAAPELGLWQKFYSGPELTVDFERDVAAAALVVEIVYREGRPEGRRTGWILDMNRDVQATTLFKTPAAPETVQGLAVPAYPAGEEAFVAVPNPRLVVYATRDYLARLVNLPREAKGKTPGPLPVSALAAPGEITFAARVSPAMKDAVREEYAAYRQSRLAPGMEAEGLIEFGMYYNLVRVAIEAETVTGSLDLARPADAVRADVRFASKQMAPFMVAVLQAMADPLQMGLPALLGGAPLEEPLAEPFYRATADGPMVHLAMSRRSVEDFADRLLSTARLQTSRAASAANLRALGLAIRTHLAKTGAYPQVWSDLVKADLITNPSVFENPALTTHLATGDYELVPLPKDAAARNAWTKIQAYEVYPKDAPPPGLNVLFVDGHVDYVEYGRFQELYRQTVGTMRP